MASLNVLLLAIKHIGVRGYLLANILALLLTNLLVFVLGKYANELEKSKHDSMLLKEMLWYSTPLILNNISWWVIQSSDKVMIEYMLGPAMLGLYTVAAKIPALINVVISIFRKHGGYLLSRNMKIQMIVHFTVQYKECICSLYVLRVLSISQL